MMVGIATAMRDIFGLSRAITTINGQASRIREVYDKVAASASSAGGSRTAAASGMSTAKSVLIKGLHVATPGETENGGGKVLLSDLNLEIQGTSRGVLIRGPNGAGKSSLFRVLAGVWQPREGTVSMPGLVGSSSGTTDSPVAGRPSVMFLPQRPYLVPGATLRENLLYPTATAAGTANGASAEGNDGVDSMILTLLSEFGLTRPSEFDTAAEWLSDRAWATSHASPGMRQRLCAVRLLLAQPTFAFVDEATAHTSSEFELQFFTRCRQLGITLITISHSTSDSLVQHHDKVLELDGDGGFSVAPVAAAKP